MLYGFDPHLPSEVVPSGEVARYPLDLDDYKSELVRGLELIRRQVKESTEAYRESMKRHFDNAHAVEDAALPKVGSRVFMKLPVERRKSKHPKPAHDWNGPFRVTETSDTSALISRIGAEEEPLPVKMDLLRVCPRELKVRAEDKRRPRTRRRGYPINVKRVSVRKVVSDMCEVSLSQITFSRADREFDVEDEMHCLHGLFRCQPFSEFHKDHSRVMPAVRRSRKIS